MAPALTRRAAWTMLLVLCGAFTLSQAYRTIAAIMAAPLVAEFGLSARQLGVFAAAFHFAFGALQLLMGIGIDLHGLRRTVLVAFPLAALGSLVSALAPDFNVLVAGQVLIGIGCAPAFVVCTVFIARHFPAERFAAVSGGIIGLGGLGMLITGTPMAWLIEATSWRVAFWVLGGASLLAWAAIARLVHEPVAALPAAGAAARETLGSALRSVGVLLRLPHTLGIVLMALVTYAAFVALRGLWLGPMLTERHGFSLVASGNVALAMSVLALGGPPLFGRLDPGPQRRRRWILLGTAVTSALFVVLAFGIDARIDVGLSIAFGLLSGYMVLQYPDVKAAYSPAVTGRALSLFTMAMFLGVALMQWVTGAIASAAQARGVEPFLAVYLGIAAMLALGGVAYAALPGPPAGRDAAAEGAMR